jgi:hypothetical protein
VTGPERKRRYQVMLEPKIAEAVRARYGGNLSAAISVACRVMLMSPPPVNPIWPGLRKKRIADSGDGSRK